MDDAPARFRVLRPMGLAKWTSASIPWEVIAPHEAQAQSNHYQSLRRLNERGGLSWCEMAAVLEDRPWRKMTDAEAQATVERLVDAYEGNRKDGSSQQDLLPTPMEAKGG